MIERTYLQWVGTAHFDSPERYIEDVREKGVCKKLPNYNVASTVAKSGTVIFLAHDQGKARECLACAEMVTCPLCSGMGVTVGSEGTDTCPRCRGLGALERGTGGYAVVDGERWTYTRLLRLRKNRTHEFWKTKHEIGTVQHCSACGGRGRIPRGVVFAFYCPERVLYATSDADAAGARERLSGAGIDAIVPTDRSHHDLVPGSYYAITMPRPPLPDAEMLSGIEKLVGPGVLYCGTFGKLAEVIPYDGKHFRGLKRWEVPVHVPDEPQKSPMEGVA